MSQATSRTKKVTRRVAPTVTPTSSTGPTFETRLRAVADDAKRLSYKLLKVRTKLTGEFLTQDALAHESYTAAFEAFIAAGGDVEQWAEFPWEAEHDTLVQAALKELRATLVGKTSTFGDVRSRLQERPNRAINAQDAWTAWAAPEVSAGRAAKGQPASARLTPVLSGEYLGKTQQEQDLAERELSGLAEALSAILKPRERDFLLSHYQDGVPQIELARQLVADGTYTDEAKASNYVYVVIHRAKRKAAALLATRWKDLVGEIA